MFSYSEIRAYYDTGYALKDDGLSWESYENLAPYEVKFMVELYKVKKKVTNG